MTSLLLASFVAGFLTVLVPCMLPFLPIILGSSLATTDKIRRNPYVIIGALLLSIILFTIFIEWMTMLFYVPQEALRYTSAVLVLLVGISFLFPQAWGRVPFIAKIFSSSNTFLGKNFKRKGLLGDLGIGIALGPLFSSCSPTYLLILAVILPSNFLLGLLYLLSYVAGLGVILLFIALLGQTLTSKLTIAATKGGVINKVVGISMLLLAAAIFLNLDKEFATLLLDLGFIDITQFELDVTSQQE